MPAENVNPNEDYLYVQQLESACVSVDDPSIKMLAADDITTSCCVVIRHTGSLAMGLGHFDGHDTKNGLERLLDRLVQLTNEWARQNQIGHVDMATRFRFEVHLIGGFEDMRGISTDVVMQLLESFHEISMETHLKTACICANNTYYQDNIPFPCIRGLLCHVRTGRISPASFTNRGPLEEVRRLRFTMRPPIIMHCVYTSASNMLEINLYDSTLTDETIQQLLGLNTNSFLHFWSTSPLTERPQFVPFYKLAMKFLKDNRMSLFCSGQAFRFVRNNGQWKLVE